MAEIVHRYTTPFGAKPETFIDGALAFAGAAKKLLANRSSRYERSRTGLMPERIGLFDGWSRLSASLAKNGLSS